MFALVVKRLLGAIPVFFLATAMAFVAVSTTQDPTADLGLSDADESAKERFREVYNLDKPIAVRYGIWLKDVASGDLGESLSQDSPVSEVLVDRGKNTLLLATPAFFLTSIFGTLAGVFSALKQYSKTDYAITSVSYLGLAMPTFLVGLFLQVGFGIWLQKYTGFKPFYVSGMHTEGILDYVSSVTLPALTLMLVFLAGDSRFIRASVLDTKRADFVRTARAKGVSERKVVVRHIWRNTMNTAVTLWSLNAAALFGGTLVTETVFSWPGYGRLLITAIRENDLDLLMGVILVITLLVVFLNLVADILYGVLDPRVKHG